MLFFWMDIIGGSDRDISAGSGYLFIVKPPKGVRSIQSIRYSVLSPRILKLVKRSHPAGTMSQSIVAMARTTNCTQVLSSYSILWFTKTVHCSQ